MVPSAENPEKVEQPVEKIRKKAVRRAGSALLRANFRLYSPEVRDFSIRISKGCLFIISGASFPCLLHLAHLSSDI